MVPSIRNSNSDYHASYSRADDWNACCARAMGFELEDWAFVDVVEAEGSGDAPTLQVTNLLPGELFEEEADNKPVSDPWTENAMNIQADLERMANWIQSKKWLFISFDSMEDAEASLIQSTVTSFAATTANDIESLRKMTLSSGRNSNETHHRTGIVQILLARLKDDVVEPFGILQKHRSREAVRLWQNPLQCRLLVKRRAKSAKKPRDEFDQVLGLDDEDSITNEQEEIEKSRREQRFLPTRDAHQLRHRFMDTYQRDHEFPQTALKRPKSLIREPLATSSSGVDQVYQANIENRHPSTGQHRTQPMLTGLVDFQLEQLSEEQNQQIHQETLLLQSMVNSDLDSVQKMEHQMVSITSLLTQFSELVSEQQEEVWHIHDTAKETKQNMEKGQETLVDAAEKTHQSKHYTAKGIFAMACLLLLFHWLRP